MLKFIAALLFAQVLLAAPVPQEPNCADNVYHDPKSDEYYVCVKQDDERIKQHWKNFNHNVGVDTHPLVTMDGSEYNTALIH